MRIICPWVDLIDFIVLSANCLQVGCGTFQGSTGVDTFLQVELSLLK